MSHSTGRFIAGTVYDPKAKKIIEDADCVLTDAATGKAYSIKTDNYGDFWFEGLKEGVYSLQIIKGKKKEVFKKIDTTQTDINLGDIPMRL